MTPTEIVVTNGETFILILCGIGAFTLIDFTLFYAYNKAYEVYFGKPIKPCVPDSDDDGEAPIGARIRTLNRSAKNIQG
jgi:hypothetical protein